MVGSSEATTRTEAKVLVVNMTDGSKAPKYIFKGTWTGRDIHVVKQAMQRAYALHQRSVRRERDSSAKIASTQPEQGRV